MESEASGATIEEKYELLVQLEELMSQENGEPIDPAELEEVEEMWQSKMEQLDEEDRVCNAACTFRQHIYLHLHPTLAAGRARDRGRDTRGEI